MFHKKNEGGGGGGKKNNRFLKKKKGLKNRPFLNFEALKPYVNIFEGLHIIQNPTTIQIFIFT
jgi:hypothetical protein